MILVFEDLQWAGAGLLDFIDYLLEWAAEYPIFILALGRPEVAPRRGDWGDGRRAQAPPRRRDGEIARQRRSSAAAGCPGPHPAERRRDPAVRRRDGADARGPWRARAGRAAIHDLKPEFELDVPETLQALVAARLDNLDAAERGLLQDAAVLGMSFGPGALAAVSGRPAATVQRILDLLVARQVLARDDDARVGQQGQYRFLQAIVRMVALGSLPRRTAQGTSSRRRRVPAAELGRGCRDRRGTRQSLSQRRRGRCRRRRRRRDPRPCAGNADRRRATRGVVGIGHRGSRLLRACCHARRRPGGTSGTARRGGRRGRPRRRPPTGADAAGRRDRGVGRGRAG